MFFLLFYDPVNGKILDFEVINIDENTIIPKNAIILDENTYLTVSHEPQFWKVDLKSKNLLRDESYPSTEEIPLEIIKDRKMLEIKAKAQEDFMNSYSSYYSGEVETWNQQEQGIIDIESGKDTICSRFVTRLAELYNMTLDELTTKIRKKIEDRNELLLQILGQQKRLINQIYSSTNKEEIMNIEWDYIITPPERVV